MIAPATPNRPLLEYFKSTFEPERLANRSEKCRERYRTAIAHLRGFLKRPPSVADLESETLEEMLDWLGRTGRSSGTQKASREPLLHLGRYAALAGLLDEAPHVAPVARVRGILKPWSIAELNQLLGSARTMPGDIDGIPARLWWPALVITLLDTDCTVSDALGAHRDAYRRSGGTLAAGAYVYRLHSLSVEALESLIQHDHDRLLPWPWDGGSEPFHILYRRFRHLLYRARLAHVSHNLFVRLHVTSQAIPDVLDLVDPKLPFKPREGKPRLARAADKRRWNKPKKKPGGPAVYVRAVCSCPPIRADRLVRIDSKAEWTLRRFFEEKYLPTRLVARGAAETSIVGHRTAINKLCDFAGCEVTLSQLSDELIEGFVTWTVASGRSPVTANGRTACLLAQWRYAWRKKLVDELPRDCEKLPTPKRMPEAWNQEEMARLLAASAAAEGEVSGIPAGLFWTAVVLTFYDTGIRRTTLFRLRTEHLKGEMLFVPADLQKQSADQLFKLHPQTLAVVKATNPDSRRRLFPWPYRLENVGRHFRRILQAAGLPHGRRDLFHKIRRTSGTYVENAAGPQAATEHLGHSGRQVTKLYIDPRLLNRTYAADVLPRPEWDASGLLAGEGVQHG